MLKVLFIGLVWPEPTSSAAGTRILQLVCMFQEANFNVHFVSAAGRSPHSYPLHRDGVQEKAILLNDRSFDDYLKKLQPEIVVYDRFIVEEQFGWRVREYCPEALTILDTEDLHFLRKARQEAIKKDEALDYFNDLAKRELASLYRTDLSLLISKTEIDILVERFAIPEGQLYYLPFLERRVEDVDVDAWNTFDEREHIMFIGNFLHEPNWNTVQFLKTKIWPLLRKELPNVELHIYGAYATQKVYQLHQPKERFFIKDRAEDVLSTMSLYRLLVAPIRFGAGIKGKFIDAMRSGTPSVTTSMGAESMTLEGRWGGVIEDDIAKFVQQTVLLYQNEKMWKESQREGQRLLNDRFDKELYESDFIEHLSYMKAHLDSFRSKNYIGQILSSQQFNSTKYMALWIEEKNRNR